MNTTEPADQGDALFDMCQDATLYPETVIDTCERAKVIEGYRKHFEENEQSLFDEIADTSLHLLIRDYGDEERPGEITTGYDFRSMC
jgi:hypothetical protein